MDEANRVRQLYKKLVVPVKMRSIYWRYFGFPATDDGTIISKEKIVCSLCGNQVAYSYNTSNLRIHLQSKHLQKLNELEASEPSDSSHNSPSAQTRVNRSRRKRIRFNSGQPVLKTLIDRSIQLDENLELANNEYNKSVNPNVRVVLINNEEREYVNPNVRVVLSNNDYDTTVNPNVRVVLEMPQSQLRGKNVTTAFTKNISDTVLEYIILDLQAPAVVEGQAFHRLVATLVSPCEIPSRDKLEDELLPRYYETWKDSVQSTLSCIIGDLGLSVEEWLSASGQVYITISAHFLTTESTLESKVLSTLSCTSETDAVQWGQMIDIVFEDWEIKLESVTAVLSATSRTELLDALLQRNLTVIPCLMYTMQQGADLCFRLPVVESLLTKCRNLVTVLTQSASAATALQIQEQMHQCDDTRLVLDHPGIWLSTFQMIEGLTEREKVIGCVFDGLLETENGERPECNPTPEEWALLHELQSILEPLKVTIMSFSEESAPLISLIKPFVSQLITVHLNPKKKDSMLGKSVKKALSELLSLNYNDVSVNTFLQMATMLDPRFKHMPYATPKEIHSVQGYMESQLRECVSARKVQEESEGLSSSSEDSKRHLSGMVLLLGSMCTSKTCYPNEDKSTAEMIQYQSEQSAPLESCPLQWWAKMETKCPLVARLFCKYCCIPAVSLPPQRIPPDQHIPFTLRRAALAPHLVDKMLFLYNNCDF